MRHNIETLKKGDHFLRETLMPRYAGFRSKKPLKVGILADIRELHPNVPLKVTTAALHIHCSAFKYLLNLKTAKHRVDLTGAIAGELDPDHKKRAMTKIRALDARRRGSRAGKGAPTGLRPIETKQSLASRTTAPAPQARPIDEAPRGSEGQRARIAITSAEIGPSGRPKIVLRRPTAP
jgi:sRNA-binding protein